MIALWGGDGFILRAQRRERDQGFIGGGCLGRRRSDNGESAGASRVREIWNAAKETRLDAFSQI